MTAERQPLSRRRLLLGGALTAGGLVAAGRMAATPAQAEDAPDATAGGAAGVAIEPCWGPHQAGVATAPQAFATFVGLRLRGNVDSGALVRLMRLWTDDIERLTAGEPALADVAPELAAVPARLTITVGFGPGVFRLAGLARQRPAWLAPLPAFDVDRLQPRWSGGDLLLQIRADDPVTVSHAHRVLLADAAGFARQAWVQGGFQRSLGMTPAGSTPRNLMGYIDGTVNPEPGTADFDQVVWSQGQPAWLAGGTGMVLRRVRMDMRTWASVDRRSRELAMGRRMDTGAPLTGTQETDTPDFDARNADGMLTIPEFAHIRVAHGRTGAEQISRQPYNYDDVVDGVPDTGLLFVAYAADLQAQFVPIQRRLDRGDLLNLWTTPIGSAVFAIPPGFESGGFLGESLLA